MPKVSTIGLVNKVRGVTGATTVGPDDTWITLQAGWVASTIKLPGPSSTPGDLPSSGDFYKVGDPLGLLGSAHATINGGGYPIQGASTLVLVDDYAEACFTFDDTAQAWIACVCIPSE